MAPPSLGTYADARRSAGPSLSAVRRRMMPPFGPDDTGLCGTWLDSPWLSDAEIASWSAWVEGGMPRGAPAEPGTTPVGPQPPAGLAAESETLLTVGTRMPFVPGLGERAHRCFVVEPPSSRDLAITGVTVQSEPGAAVRQAALYELGDRAAVKLARTLDAADPGPGWACDGGPGVHDAKLLASWSRNTPLQRLPQATAVPLARDAVLVLQLRYDLVTSAPGVPVRASMLLATSAPGRRIGRARLVRLAAAPFVLRPGQAQARVHVTLKIDRPALLLGLVPRMQTLGRVLDLERTRGAKRECLAHFGHWDVYDEQLFRRARTVALARGDEVELTCEFSTASRDLDTKMGEAPDNEQCLAHLYLVDVP
jgi:hypothetical protein